MPKGPGGKAVKVECTRRVSLSAQTQRGHERSEEDREVASRIRAAPNLDGLGVSPSLENIKTVQPKGCSRRAKRRNRRDLG